jgi:hypothetical protein
MGRLATRQLDHLHTHLQMVMPPLGLCRLDVLPDDVIKDILSHLDPQSLRTARLVSRQLRKFATSCIKLYVLTGPITVQQPQFLPDDCRIRAHLDTVEDAIAPPTSRCLPLLQELRLSNPSAFRHESASGRAALGLFLAATRLTSLVISDEGEPDDSTLADILSHCSALHTLRLTGCTPWRSKPLSLPNGLTQLQELLMPNHPRMAPGSLMRISSWSCLRVLRGITVESESELAHVATTLTALTDLDIRAAFRRREGSLAPLSLLSSLKAFGIHGGYRCSYGLTPVGSLTQLTSLTVGSGPSWRMMCRLQSLSHLRSLDLGVELSVVDGGPSLLLGMPLGSLTHLGLESPGLVATDFSGVLVALGRASCVESLRLGLDSSCVDGGLANVLSTLARLTHLEFSGCRYVEPESFPPHVVPKLTGLRSLDLCVLRVDRVGLQEIAGLSSLTRLHLWVSNDVTPPDARCLGRLTNLGDFKVTMRDRCQSIKCIVPCPGYPFHIYTAAFLDVQAARRNKGWQDLKLWEGPKGAGFPCSTIRWFVPGFEWDEQDES